MKEMKEYKVKVFGYGIKWYNTNNQLHREGGPAIENNDGHKSWYKNGERHREDGPAIEYASGDKSWWINGKLHREDGPAIEYINGYKAWYINGKELTEEQFNQHRNVCDGRVIEIEGKQYKLNLIK